MSFPYTFPGEGANPRKFGWGLYGTLLETLELIQTKILYLTEIKCRTIFSFQLQTRPYLGTASCCVNNREGPQIPELAFLRSLKFWLLILVRLIYTGN